ncbi:MAG: single-stranded DNA-binding protein [Bacteroidales bacterium]|nr:single-stranded DNA-binding protein [Bacteroidales bacterium]
MAGVNKVILIGNLGKDPDVRSLESGAKVANFTIATTEYFKGKDGQRQEATEWHNIVLWNQLAELAEKYLKKGNSIYLEGRIKTRSYDDKDGVKKYITEIFGNQMTFLGGPKSEGSSQQASGSGQGAVQDADVVEDPDDGDLPF